MDETTDSTNLLDLENGDSDQDLYLYQVANLL